MTLEKLPHENEEQYIYRIGCAKDDGLINDSWLAIADACNVQFRLSEDEWLGESAYRKAYQYAKRFHDAKAFPDMAQDTVKSLQEREDAIRKERIKLQTLNVERSRYDREESRQELYYEYLRDTITALPLPDFEPLNATDEEYEKKYIACIADIHYGAKFKSINNEYSPKIFYDRLVIFAEQLLGFVKQKRLRTIHILELGDTIQGILRISDLKLNDSSVVKSVVEVSRYLAVCLNEISKYVNIEYYHVGTSNHSQIRPLGSKTNQLADEDLEYVIGNYIKDLLRGNNRVNVHLVENGEHFIDIEDIGFNVVAAHGHQFNNIDTAIRDLSMVRRDIVDYLIVGHYHNGKNMDMAEGTLHNIELLCCPSFVGSDPYSDHLMKGSKPAVAIFGFDELYGHTETYKIML